ncbi:MAG: polyprenyl synthetase family protein [Chlorobi bacterium]|nr:polyprenyl synthetase family protein [Chlorobiota bacterium]MCI0715236.1 polyprenyl synthetase family protein [Chlorobiota bacterium]
MESQLKKISKPIEKELEEFRDYFREAIRSRVALVDLIGKYILRQKGKKIRPILVLLSAKLCGEVNSRTYTAATLVEMLHTATLIHDDVVDDAKTRRGLASINAVWKNKIAVLMGDFMLSRGLLLALEKDECGFLKITSRAVKRMSEGELLQIQKNRKFDVTEETYFKIISDKTASLITACCELGAASTSKDGGEVKLLSEFGENIGIAFQLRDDLLDYIGKEKIMGKSSGTDLKEKKFTLPLIYSLNNASKKEGKEMINIVKNGSYSKSRGMVMDFIKEHRGIEYTVDKTAEYCSIAKSKIKGFKSSDTKETMIKFADFISDRIN